MKKILFSILLNSFTLFAIAFFLSSNPEKWLTDWVILCWWHCELFSQEAFITYVIWWIIMWFLNYTIRPILKILSLPFYIFFFFLVSFIINFIIFRFFSFIINDILQMPEVSYVISWEVNFIIAVAIFTFLNMFYSLLFLKR